MLFLLFFYTYSLCFSQSEEHGFKVTYSDGNYNIYDSFFDDKNDIGYRDFVEFLDWRFVDSFRVRLKEFYDCHFEYDSLSVKLAGLILKTDSSGKVVFSSLVIPEKSGKYCSLESIKKLNELIRSYQFDFPDFHRPVLRFTFKHEKAEKINSFGYFDIIYSINSDGTISSNWDEKLQNQLYRMILGIWKDTSNQKLVFSGKDKNISVKMLHPLSGILGDYQVNFNSGILYIEFGRDKRYPLTYKFSGDHLTLSGDIEGRAVKWELTRRRYDNQD